MMRENLRNISGAVILIILVKNETFEKKDETKGIFSRFFQLLMPQKKLIFQIFLA